MRSARQAQADRTRVLDVLRQQVQSLNTAKGQGGWKAMPLKEAV
jgi:hypothetical protein